MSEQSAWLIERGSTAEPLYWSGFGIVAWTRNPEHAVWFQRESDASRVADGLLKYTDARIAEHLWIGSGNQAPQEHAATPGRSEAP